MHILILLISVLFVSFIATGIVLHIVRRKKIIDTPNERSSHTIPTPRGGGVAIAITWFLTITYLFIIMQIDSTIFFALLCGIPISIIGFVDDIITVSPKARFFVQITSAIVALIFLGGIDSVDIGFTLLSIPILFNVLAVIGIVWFTNLFNFLDGIDGYVSNEIIFIGLVFYIFYGTFTPLILVIVTLGFLIWNWAPAKIFMGDVGSTLLGFTIGVFAIYYQNVNISSIFIWIMLTSLFWFDATITLYRRWRNGEKLSQAHKKHAYQRIVQAGWSHKKAVLWSLVVNMPILLIIWISIRFSALILPMLVVNITYLYILMKQVDKRCAFS